MNITDRHTDTAAAPTRTGEVMRFDSSLWSAFLNARSASAYLTSWLAVLISRVDAARMAVLLQADTGAGAFVPVAVVPDPRRDLSHLKEIAEAAINSARPVSLPGDDGLMLVAYPILTQTGGVRTVAVLELVGQGAEIQQKALQELHWAAGWLSSRAWEEDARSEMARVVRSGVAIDMLALAGEHRKPAACAMALVNEMHARLGYDHVAIGMVRRRRGAPRIALLAMSHAAWFRRRSRAAELLETAMEESFDQRGAVSYPPLPGLDRAISVAHGDLIKAGRIRQVLSVLLSDDEGPVGVLSVERRKDEPRFDENDHLTLEAVAALIGPVLETKRRGNRWLAGRLVDTIGHALGVVLGPRRLSWKLLTLAVIAAVVAATVMTGPFRVQSEAVLRGAIQRAATAPFAGFIAAAPLRAGDRVAVGDELARLEDTDLRLELLRTRSEMDRLSVQARDAMARYERAQFAALEAQIEQARAQANLAEAQLGRTRITAPIAGTIVQGDLSQRLGAPVQAGEVLFEIVPDAAYRVDIFVDERDLRFVELGQQGHLALTGHPSDALPMTVTRITPVAEAREGFNAFRVEALLDGTVPEDIRPGMEGRAKIGIDERRYVWIWSRRMVDWMRQKLWTWQP